MEGAPQASAKRPRDGGRQYGHKKYVMQPGLQGFLFTVSPGTEPRATRELQTLLGEYIAPRVTDTDATKDDAEGGGGSLSVSAMLAEELAEAKTTRGQHPQQAFHFTDTKCKGYIFFQVDKTHSATEEEIAPPTDKAKPDAVADDAPDEPPVHRLTTSYTHMSDVALKICTDMKEKKRVGTKFAFRMLPCTMACAPRLEPVMRVVKDILTAFHASLTVPTTINASVQMRNNDKAEKDKAIIRAQCDSLICSFPKFIRDYKPLHVLHVTVLHSVACIGLILRSKEMEGYNLNVLGRIDLATNVERTTPEGGKAVDVPAPDGAPPPATATATTAEPATATEQQ